MNEKITTRYSLIEHLNPLLQHQARNYDATPESFKPEQLPSGSVVVISGKFWSFNEDSIASEDFERYNVTVDSFIKLKDDGRYVLVADVICADRWPLSNQVGRGCSVAIMPTGGGAVRKDETIKSYFLLSSVVGIVSVGSGKARIRQQSQYFREYNKAHRNFPAAFFTPGTKVRLSQSSMIDKEQSDIVTVNTLSFNGPDSFVMITADREGKGEFAGQHRTINISHVIEIISHVPGVLKWEHHPSHEHRFDSDRMRGTSKQIAGKNHFVGYLSEIAQHSIVQYLSESVGVCYSVDKLMTYLEKSGMVHMESIHDGWDHAYAVNKKKLKRTVRRLQGKISISARKVQEKYDNDMNTMMDADYRD